MTRAIAQARRDEIVGAFRKQAVFCETRGAAFTAAIVTAAGDELAAGNKDLWSLLEDFDGDPRKGALALRIAGALHGLVLMSRGGGLVSYYQTPEHVPSAADLRQAMAPLFAEEADLFADYISSPPQTNEINRASALLFGFSIIAKETGLPLDLYEPGASAGLLLCWDKFKYDYDAFSWGTEGAAILSDLKGDLAPDLYPDITVVGRRGCDLNPKDISDPGTLLKMRSYIWPEDRSRKESFENAAREVLAAELKVEKGDVVSWVKARLSGRAEDRVSVVYHSVFTQYVGKDDLASLAAMMESAGQTATTAAPLAWLQFEPEDLEDGEFEFFLDLQLWPGGEKRRLLRAHPHGRWVEPLCDF